MLITVPLVSAPFPTAVSEKVPCQRRSPSHLGSQLTWRRYGERKKGRGLRAERFCRAWRFSAHVRMQHPWAARD